MARELLGVEMYSSKETAELLGVTLQTLRSYVRKGYLTGVCIGKTKYYSKEMLIAFLQSKTQPKAEQ